ncbi:MULTISPECIES: lysophospholipid acyltransferase family protein [Alphaproteobacteria]|uniref:1-acyl-sn-glycerol-3-phosphate acyltransferase n=2 Tax=Alphaproteobacteria TaxID=28211 RepID=A0A512HM08_9HYPH|nr:MULTISPECIES: lysophospholipid acyltransferase family protein [Alphaproteobacteria]GEO86492.1 1-acyl-sn-glycerol-3-phosphate acyltransferase [Ciceribacter naphthalenivorans]GLR23849.1 1-acyl-sn-glycerol-3-phosphate acyltransferase [Ciceribacter naphthalenivorans]GLT06705.1 1-acyl-sn-glycerol-3-phosphate acyltransferase [Sphingomonas psychrolutea]
MHQINLKSHLFDALFAVWTALFALGVPVFWLVGSPGKAIRAATRVWVRGVLFALKHVARLDYVETGRDLIPAEPCLIVCNHQSTWETIAFLVLFPDVAIVAKQELLRIPIVSWYLRKSPMIIIDRETGSKALKIMLNQSCEALVGGRSVLLFPEGTRMKELEPIQFKRGVELLYAKLGVPVLPVVVNSGKYWGPGRSGKRSGTITVSYLPPIPPGMPAELFVRKAEAQMEAERSRLI